MKLSPSGVYFFLSFLFFKVSCASLQIGPFDRSSPLMAQMTRPGGHHVLFMVSLITKIFSNIFNYNFGIVEDTYKLFAPNGVFEVGQFSGVTCPSPTPVAMVTN